MRNSIKKFFIIVFCGLFFTCSSTDTREEKILDFSESSVNKYEKYLVDSEQYSTNGAEYHKKYYKYLIGVAHTIIENKKYEIVERSIGFYYDKKEENRNSLFLGVDIAVIQGSPLQYSSYNGVAIALLEKYLREILYVVHSCKKVFAEDSIVGTVLGIRWESGSLKAVNIWIDQKDVVRFESDNLTFREIIQRNQVTNTEGKIIRLPI